MDVKLIKTIFHGFQCLAHPDFVERKRNTSQFCDHKRASLFNCSLATWRSLRRLGKKKLASGISKGKNEVRQETAISNRLFHPVFWNIFILFITATIKRYVIIPKVTDLTISKRYHFTSSTKRINSHSLVFPYCMCFLFFLPLFLFHDKNEYIPDW